MSTAAVEKTWSCTKAKANDMQLLRHCITCCNDACCKNATYTQRTKRGDMSLWYKRSHFQQPRIFKETWIPDSVQMAKSRQANLRATTCSTCALRSSRGWPVLASGRPFLAMPTPRLEVQLRRDRAIPQVREPSIVGLYARISLGF